MDDSEFYELVANILRKQFTNTLKRIFDHFSLIAI